MITINIWVHLEAVGQINLVVPIYISSRRWRRSRSRSRILDTGIRAISWTETSTRTRTITKWSGVVGATASCCAFGIRINSEWGASCCCSRTWRWRRRRSRSRIRGTGIRAISWTRTSTRTRTISKWWGVVGVTASCCAFGGRINSEWGASCCCNLGEKCSEKWDWGEGWRKTHDGCCMLRLGGERGVCVRIFFFKLGGGASPKHGGGR